MNPPAAASAPVHKGRGADSPTAAGVLVAFPDRLGASSSPHYTADGALALQPEPLRVDMPSATEMSAERSAAIVARALLEVLAGWRPAGQLARWTSYALQQDLERRAPRRPTGSRQRLLKLRVSVQAPGIAEVCAISHDPGHGRVRVMAFRLETRSGAWIVTRLQAG